MTQAYVITEGRTDIEILKHLLPQPLLAETTFVEGGGGTAALSLSSTILAVKQRPVALIMDADTENQTEIEKRENFLRGWLQQTAAGTPFSILIAVPEIEVIFFQDQVFIERIANQSFSESEWLLMKHQPKQSLQNLKKEIDQPFIDWLLANLDETTIRVLQTHSLLEHLISFLDGVLVEKVDV
jgi:hypothetical protein